MSGFSRGVALGRMARGPHAADAPGLSRTLDGRTLTIASSRKHEVALQQEYVAIERQETPMSDVPAAAKHKNRCASTVPPPTPMAAPATPASAVSAVGGEGCGVWVVWRACGVLRVLSEAVAGGAGWRVLLGGTGRALRPRPPHAPQSLPPPYPRAPFVRAGLAMGCASRVFAFMCRACMTSPSLGVGGSVACV